MISKWSFNIVYIIFILQSPTCVLLAKNNALRLKNSCQLYMFRDMCFYTSPKSACLIIILKKQNSTNWFSQTRFSVYGDGGSLTSVFEENSGNRHEIAKQPVVIGSGLPFIHSHWIWEPPKHRMNLYRSHCVYVLCLPWI